MSFRDEIEKQLKEMPVEFCVAFAARLALRILPLLALSKMKQPFWYWKGKNNKEIYLLATLKASRLSLLFGFGIVQVVFSRNFPTSQKPLPMPMMLPIRPTMPTAVRSPVSLTLSTLSMPPTRSPMPATATTSPTAAMPPTPPLPQLMQLISSPLTSMLI